MRAAGDLSLWIIVWRWLAIAASCSGVLPPLRGAWVEGCRPPKGLSCTRTSNPLTVRMGVVQQKGVNVEPSEKNIN